MNSLKLSPWVPSILISMFAWGSCLRKDKTGRSEQGNEALQYCLCGVLGSELESTTLLPLSPLGELGMFGVL